MQKTWVAASIYKLIEKKLLDDDGEVQDAVIWLRLDDAADFVSPAIRQTSEGEWVIACRVKLYI